jgi:ATP-dependent Clp protease protease subunit
MLTIPDIIETVGRNKKIFSIPTKLYEQNIITLFDEIDDDSAYSIITQLLYADTLKTNDPVKLYINSPGGSVTAGLAIIDTIEVMSRKVDTVGIGSCASMGQVILSSGTGERKILKNTRVMMHSVTSGTGGTVHDQIVQLDETKYLQERLMEIIANTTKGCLSVEDVKNMTQRDKYMSAEECVKYGLVDSIVK